MSSYTPGNNSSDERCSKWKIAVLVLLGVLVILLGSIYLAITLTPKEINDDMMDEIFEEVSSEEIDDKPLNVTVEAVPKQADEELSDIPDLSSWDVECMTTFENTLMKSSWKQSEQKNVAEYYDSIGVTPMISGLIRMMPATLTFDIDENTANITSTAMGITVEQSFYFNRWTKLFNQLFKVDDDIKIERTDLKKKQGKCGWKVQFVSGKPKTENEEQLEEYVQYSIKTIKNKETLIVQRNTNLKKDKRVRGVWLFQLV